MKRSWLYRNSLSVTFLSLMVITIILQFITGWKVKNEDQVNNHQPELSAAQYIISGHFIEATFENWESEFLQMGLYVILTIFLRQWGSSESKSLDETEDVDKPLKKRPDSPWPVRKGGFWLTLYSYSLSLAFIVLFLVSFILHFYGSMKEFNDEQMEQGKHIYTGIEYLASSKFWFESFQNWQSEFLSVASILVLSIFLRQKGSPESKPVDAPHHKTG